MTKRTKKGLTLVLTAVFLFSLTMFLGSQADKASGTGTYERALVLAASGSRPEAAALQPSAAEDPGEETRQEAWIPAPIQEEDPHLDTLAALDLETLREVEPNVAGWIWIPDTKVNYPLMQGGDNEFYLNHTWDGQSNSVGSIFLEHRNSPDLTDFNTIVYGHNMNDGSMFASIKQYCGQWYWELHPYIYIRIGSGIFRYEVFSSYQARTDSGTYGLSFQQEQTRVDFLVEAVKNSAIQTGVEPELTDRVLTLSTCSGAGYSTRWVVHARLKMVRLPLDQA